MSYLNEICCPDHPYATLFEDYKAGNMVYFSILYVVFNICLSFCCFFYVL